MWLCSERLCCKESLLYTNLTVYPKKYAHGFVVLCFVVVMQSFIINSHEVFIHIHQGCFAGTGAIVRLPQCQWSKPDGYGKISQCITTTKHSKAKPCAYFLGYTVYGTEIVSYMDEVDFFVCFWVNYIFQFGIRQVSYYLCDVMWRILTQHNLAQHMHFTYLACGWHWVVST